MSALAGESATALFTDSFVSAEELRLDAAATAQAGVYVILVENSDGKRSNLLPLTVE